jgi:3-hydroxyacyl-CoA dehydrogenase
VSQPSLTERLGIAGTGAIAGGLARLAAPLGEVVVWARSPDSESRAREAIGDEALVTTDIDALGSCSFIIEAVVEDGAIKAELLGRLGSVASDEAVLASTTSSLPLDPLADATGRPDRFAAIHVFNPVEKMDLVELAFPDAASDDTRARARELCTGLGKTVVEVPGAPGFIVNRLLFPYLFSAVRLMERHALDPEAVDECMKLGAGHPMGPLALLDFVGLDVAAAIGESLGEEVPARIRELVAAGELGRKSGAGFYSYEN